MNSEAPLPAPPDPADPSVADQARQTGARLAEHPLLAAREGERPPPLRDVLADAKPLLGTYGIGFDILRSRPGVVVLRARSDGPVSPQVSCELVKGLVHAVATDVCGVQSSLVENTCAQRGAPACLYSLMWEESPPVQRPPGPPPPETLFDPPLQTSPEDWAPPAPGQPGTAPPAPEKAGAPSWSSWQVPTAAGPAEPRHEVVDVASQTTTAQPVPSAPVPTATSSNGYQIQVSAPGSVVTPARPAPPATVQPPAPEPRAGQSSPASPPEGPRTPATSRRRHLPRGLSRRSWLLALALVAGAAGGWFAGTHAGTSYGATATLLVQSGAGKTGPGAANDALALATTYSAAIPKDQAILRSAAGALGTSSTAVGNALGVTVETDTSILLLTYTAPSPAAALRGANVVARTVASSASGAAAIAPGSVAVVGLATSAHRQGTLHRYGVVIGALLGLLLGLILVLAAERADPRVDDAPTLAGAAGCRAALVPDELSFAELARVLSDAGREEGALTVVPLGVSDTSPAMELTEDLRPCWPSDGPSVAISPAFSTGVVELSRGSGPTVLVSHPGARQRDVLVAAERLRMIGRTPVWAVLSTRRARAGLSSRVG